MGATVSREHARLPFAYTHARKEDHSCNASSPSMSSTRQRIASRLLLLKSPDTTTSVTPLSSHRFQQQQHPLQQQQFGQGVGGGAGEDPLLDGQGVDPTSPILSPGSHMAGSEENDEDTEIVSLSSILIQGPEFELKWHAVGQDQDFLDSLMNGINGAPQVAAPPPPPIAATTTMTAHMNSGQTTMTILSAATAVSITNLLQDTDSGHHEQTCFLHSGSPALDSAQNPADQRIPLSGTERNGSHTASKGEEDVHNHGVSAAAAAGEASQTAAGSSLSEAETISPRPPSPACACSPTMARVGSPSASSSASAGGSTTSITGALTNLLSTRRGSMLSTATTAVSTASESASTLPVTTSLTPLSPGSQHRSQPHPHHHHLFQPHGLSDGDLDTDINHGELIHLDSDRESERGIDDHSEESEEDDDDCDDDYYDLDDEEKIRKMDNRKMDLIAALGIADLPEEFEPEPFNFFKGEPIFHQQPDRFMNHPAAIRRYTTDGVNSGRGFRVPWASQDDFNTAVHLPDDFFDRGLQSSIEEDSDLEELDEQSDLDGSGSTRPLGEGEGTRLDYYSREQQQDPLELRGRLSRRRLLKGKGASGSRGHAFSQSTSAMMGPSGPWRSHGPMSLGDEDVAHLSPIPFSDLLSLTNIGLCSSEIVKLSSNIRLLSSATSIQLCCNDLSSIPVEIGHLRNLTLLDLSKNTLTSLPSSIRYLTRLVDLKLSFNFLVSLPPTIGELTKLTSLYLDNNRIEQLPREIGRIKGLAHLDLNDNPLTVLPAEVGQLQFLRRLKLDRCPLVESFVHYPLHSPPTLLELAARVVVRHRMPTPHLLPSHLKTYLRGANKCSFCEGPYFESFVKRGKMIDKNDTLVPLEYSLCIPHWNTEPERVRQLFCARPPTAPPLPLPNIRLQPSRPGSGAGSRRASKSEGPLNPTLAALPTTSSAGYSSSTDLLAASASMALGSTVGSDSPRGESRPSTRKRRFGSRLKSSGASTYSLDAIPMTSSSSMVTIPLPLPPVPPLPSLLPFSEPKITPPPSRSSSSRFSIRLRSRVPKSG